MKFTSLSLSGTCAVICALCAVSPSAMASESETNSQSELQPPLFSQIGCEGGSPSGKVPSYCKKLGKVGSAQTNPGFSKTPPVRNQPAAGPGVPGVALVAPGAVLLGAPPPPPPPPPPPALAPRGAPVLAPAGGPPRVPGVADLMAALGRLQHVDAGANGAQPRGLDLAAIRGGRAGLRHIEVDLEARAPAPHLPGPANPQLLQAAIRGLRHLGPAHQAADEMRQEEVHQAENLLEDNPDNANIQQAIADLRVAEEENQDGNPGEEAHRRNEAIRAHQVEDRMAQDEDQDDETEGEEEEEEADGHH